MPGPKRGLATRYLTSPAAQLFDTWAAAWLTPMLIERGFAGTSGSYTRSEPVGHWILQAVGQSGTGRRVGFSFNAGLVSSGVLGKVRSASAGPGFGDVHLWFGMRRNPTNLHPTGWILKDADDQALAEQLVDWVDQVAVPELERFPDEQALLTQWIEHDDLDAMHPTRLREILALLRKHGPSSLIPVVEEELERDARRSLANWTTAAARMPGSPAPCRFPSSSPHRLAPSTTWTTRKPVRWRT